MIIRFAHARGELGLLALQRFDLLGQRRQLALFLIAQARAGLEGIITRRGVARGMPRGLLTGLNCAAERPRRPLLQVVTVTAGVLAPYPVSLGGQRLGDDIVEKAPVVTHQQQRPLVVLQSCFE